MLSYLCPTEAGVHRTAVESIYSLCGVTRPGSRMDHLVAIEQLVATWLTAEQDADIPDMLQEYLRRELINLVVGNTDNHGRNLAILRGKASVRFAPIYDLAPMVMDPEGVVRTIRWPEGIEQMNRVDWRRVCQKLGRWYDEDALYEGLREDAARLLALPDVLASLELPEEAWNAPMIPLNRLPSTFKSWGLA